MKKHKLIIYILGTIVLTSIFVVLMLRGYRVTGIPLGLAIFALINEIKGGK